MTAYRLSDCIKDFLFHCEFEKRLSILTIKAYSTDLTQCREQLEPNGEDILLIKVDRERIKSYLKSISSFKPKTIKRKIAALKSLLSFVEYEHEEYISPFHRLKFSIKVPIHLPVTLTIEEVGCILTGVYARVREAEMLTEHARLYAMRTAAVIELLFSAGVRVSELCSFNVSDVNLETGALLVMGKGSKERLLHICLPRVLKTLQSYRNLISKNKYSSPFFINNQGRRMSSQSVRNIVRLVSKNSGINKYITPHTFRHTFATLFLEQGVDIRYIQSFLGHSSIITTQLYTRVNKTRQKEIFATCHPRMQLDI